MTRIKRIRVLNGNDDIWVELGVGGVCEIKEHSTEHESSFTGYDEKGTPIISICNCPVVIEYEECWNDSLSNLG